MLEWWSCVLRPHPPFLPGSIRLRQTNTRKAKRKLRNCIQSSRGRSRYRAAAGRRRHGRHAETRLEVRVHVCADVLQAVPQRPPIRQTFVLRMMATASCLIRQPRSRMQFAKKLLLFYCYYYTDFVKRKKIIIIIVVSYPFMLIMVIIIRLLDWSTSI